MYSLGYRWAVFIEMMEGLPVAFTAASAGAWEMAVALWATGIPEIVIGVAALVGWLYYLYTHWDKVKESMQGVGDGVLLLLSFFAPVIGIPLLLAKHWDALKAIFTNVFDGISAKLHIFTLWANAKFIRPIKEWFSGLFDGAGNSWNKFVDSLTTVFQTHFQNLSNNDTMLQKSKPKQELLPLFK